MQPQAIDGGTAKGVRDRHVRVVAGVRASGRPMLRSSRIASTVWPASHAVRAAVSRRFAASARAPRASTRQAISSSPGSSGQGCAAGTRRADSISTRPRLQGARTIVDRSRLRAGCQDARGRRCAPPAPRCYERACHSTRSSGPGCSQARRTSSPEAAAGSVAARRTSWRASVRRWCSSGASRTAWRRCAPRSRRRVARRMRSRATYATRSRCARWSPARWSRPAASTGWSTTPAASSRRPWRPSPRKDGRRSCAPT